jgi:hypothetical protein
MVICSETNQAWTVRRPPLEFEIRIDNILACLTTRACLVSLQHRDPIVICSETNQEACTVRRPPLEFEYSNQRNGLPYCTIVGH